MNGMNLSLTNLFLKKMCTWLVGNGARMSNRGMKEEDVLLVMQMMQLLVLSKNKGVQGVDGAFPVPSHDSIQRMRALLDRFEAGEQPVAETPKEGTSVKREGSFATMVKELLAYLRSHYHLRFNALSEVTEMGVQQGVELVYRPMNDRDINSICLEAQMEGLNCWDKDVKRCIQSKFVEPYDPFELYLKGLPVWDGVDRVEALACRVSENPLWVKGFHTWMLGVTAQWMHKEVTDGELPHGHALAPILISTEQGWGKSTFCQMLLPEELRNYYTDSFDVFNPNACEKKMAKNGLINLDEFDSISPSCQSALKNLMQKSVLKYKNGNAKVMCSAPRLASFIGTTNRRDVLLDPTGSRRFLCVELTHPIDCKVPVEYAQLYAQLVAELNEGRRYWLSSEEEAEVQEQNKVFHRISPEEEVFHQMFRFAAKEEEGAVLLSGALIFEQMKKAHPAALRGITSRKFCQTLSASKHKIHTNHGNVYRVVRWS